MKFYKIVCIALLISGCNGEEEILKKYNVKEKKELCELLIRDTKLDIYSVQSLIEKLEENAPDDKSKDKEMKIFIKNLLEKETIKKTNELICNKVDKYIEIKEYEKILNKISIENKIENIDEILENNLQDILIKIPIENIEEYKTIMRKNQ